MYQNQKSVAAEDRGQVSGVTIKSEAFRAGKITPAQLYEEARAVKGDFRRGSTWLGAFLGLAVAAKLIALSVVRRRADYEPDRGACVSCGRCFAYCPVEGDRAVE